MSDGQRRASGVPQIAFGLIVIGICVVLILLDPHVTSGRGLSGALNLPSWILGAIGIAFGIGFIWLGIRVSRRGR